MTQRKNGKKGSGSSGLGASVFVVATPIGNPGDWTERAKDILSLADIVAAEDTRLAKKELEKAGIQPKKVISHHEHNEEASVKGLLEALAGGQSIALISDAGTPLISDPGVRLVRAARAAGYPVVPVPGVSSLTAALSVAGIGGKSIYFGGFLPSQREICNKTMLRLRGGADCVVFFEAPHRIRETLEAAAEIFGPQTPAVICRELTKTFEEVISKTLGELASHFRTTEPRGEFVLLIENPPVEQLSKQDTEKEALKLLRMGRSAHDILDELQNFTELTRRELYDLITQLKNTTKPQ